MKSKDQLNPIIKNSKLKIEHNRLDVGQASRLSESSWLYIKGWINDNS